jgi:S1-C subfamily serine protease
MRFAYHRPTRAGARPALDDRPSLPSTEHWAFPTALQPRPEDLPYDLAEALDAVVTVHAEIPEDAFTAGILGTERVGNGIAIREDGLLLTIGYLVTEAETIWLTDNHGRVVPGHPLAVDFATGLGLVQPLEQMKTKPLPRGSTAGLLPGDPVSILGRGGRAHALAAEVYAKREFAGYWEYLLDEALFTTPMHPEWSGAALLDERGRLCGVGSLFLQEQSGDTELRGNMFVPIDVLAPIEEELVRYGRVQRPPRPWLGLYVGEADHRLAVQGIVKNGPAFDAGVRLGDVIVGVTGVNVAALADFYRLVWSQGEAGARVPLLLDRGGAAVEVTVRSGNREDFLRRPSLQ